MAVAAAAGGEGLAEYWHPCGRDPERQIFYSFSITS